MVLLVSIEIFAQQLLGEVYDTRTPEYGTHKVQLAREVEMFDFISTNCSLITEQHCSVHVVVLKVALARLGRVSYWLACVVWRKILGSKSGK